MARQAHKAGLPGELPIMAALVESRLSNIDFGHADSVGYFQMRTSIWDQGEYAGYGSKPELQLKWFIDHALHEKQKRVERGETAFLKDSSKWGEWIADVERPAEQYRGRYQERLAEARELLGSAQAAAPPAAPDADLDAAVAGAELDAAPQAKKALAVAKQYLGTPYQWGGATPETNFDCSGLMQWSYKQVGIEIPRVTYDQVNVGEKIAAVDDLEAGDMVFFQDSSGDMHHVGMYIGGHKFIHAPHTGDVVKVSSLDEPYYAEQFAGGRRMVEAVPEVPAAAVPAAAVSEARAAPAGPAGGESGVFAGVAAETAKAPTVGAMPAVEQAAEPAAAVAEAAAAPTAPAVGAAVAPIAPEDMANTNEGGKLHASEFHVHDAEGAPGAEGNLHAGYDLFAKAGATVRSPIEGTIVEVKASRGNTGQIFGGVVKVQGADGRVWVFRHVDPRGVVDGGKVAAGQEIATVTEWAGGTHHAHIELWKTLEGGYAVTNMEDPYVELQNAYGSGGAEPADVAPALAPPASLQALLDNPNLELPAPARADLASGRVDPRLVAILTELTKEHRLGLSVIITGHDQFSSSGSVSNHYVGRGIDIASVDGEIVRPSSIASRELAEALVDLPESIRPTEVGTPWAINAPGFFTDGGHQDHLHVAFDDAPPEGFAARAAPAPALAEAQVEVPAAPAPEPPGEAVGSGVFVRVEDAAVVERTGSTVQFMRAVQDEVKAKIEQPPEPEPELAKVASAENAGAAVDAYPGDDGPEGADRRLDGGAGQGGRDPARASGDGRAGRVAADQRQLRPRRLAGLLPDARVDLGPGRIRRLRAGPREADQVVHRPRGAREAEAGRGRLYELPRRRVEVGGVGRGRGAAGGAVPRPLPGAARRSEGAARAGRSGLDQSLAHGQGDRLRARARVQLRHHVVDHVLDRPLAVAELLRDLSGGMAGRDQAQHLLLARRQPREGQAARLEDLA